MALEAKSQAELESSIYVGAIATAIVYLLPYVNDFVITAYVIGALVAVWFAIKKRRQILAYKDGAKLGFLSSFFGGIAAAIGGLILSGIFGSLFGLLGVTLFQGRAVR